MKKFAVVAVSSATLITSLAFSPPALAADPPSVQLNYIPSALAKGDATSTGAQFEPFGPIPDAVQVGSTAVANLVVKEANGGIVIGSQRSIWYACPSRGSELAACTERKRLVVGPNDLIGAGDFTYTATQDDVGKFLRVWSQVRSSATGLTTENPGTGSGQLLVWPRIATGARPTIAGSPASSSQTTIALRAWSLAPGTAFQSRTVKVYSCPAATNGQSQTYAWNTSVDGCTDVSQGIASAFNVVGATNVLFNVPAGADGRYLIASDLMLASFGSGSVTGAVVRSAATQVAVGASPSPSPSATATPTANSPTANSTAASTAAPEAAPTGKFRIAVITKSSVTRGVRLKVVVSTSTATSIGTAKVQIKKRPIAKGGAAQTLKSIDVVNGTGQSVTKVGKRLAKGNYFVFATYVDDRSGKVTTASAPITLK